MKSITVVIENYKIERFKEELNNLRFTNHEVTESNDKTSTLKIMVHNCDFRIAKKLIDRVIIKIDLHFKSQIDD
jgi:hypothetical protein